MDEKEPVFICLNNGLIERHLNSELVRLDYILTDNIARFIEMNCCLDLQLASGFEQAITKECNRVTRDWTYGIFSLPREHDRNSYIRLHQQELMRLIGHLLNYTSPHRLYQPTDVLSNDWLCQTTFRVLNDLLTFLGNNYALYCDDDMFVPDAYRKIAASDLLHDIPKLKANLAQCGIEKDFIQVILTAFNRLTHDADQPIVYGQLEYLRELKKELLQFHVFRGDDPENALRALLFRLNFNIPAYYDYIIKGITRDLRKEKKVGRRLLKLALHQKWIDQVPVIRRTGFERRTLPTLAEQVTTWIQAETRYLENNELTKQEEEEHNSTHLSDPRIDIAIPLPQFAFLLGLLSKAGIIETKNTSLIARVASSIFQCSGQQFTQERLRKKIYDVEPETRESVKAILRRLITLNELTTTHAPTTNPHPLNK